MLDPFLRPVDSVASRYNPMSKNPSQGTTLAQNPPVEELGVQFDQKTDRGLIQGNKLAANSVGTTQIADNSVGSSALMTNSVSSIKIQANAVTNAKINDVAWTKVTGGTAVLGDSANNKGVFQLLNSSSSVIGTMDNTGVQFYAGTLGTMTIGTSTIKGGTYSNPTLSGTKVLDVLAGTAALVNEGQIALQTLSGSVVLVARSGGTNFYFVNGGTF